jgi:hypothetical protein
VTLTSKLIINPDAKRRFEIPGKDTGKDKRTTLSFVDQDLVCHTRATLAFKVWKRNNVLAGRNYSCVKVARKKSHL